MNHLLFKALGDEAFSFKFEDSDLLTGLIAGETRVCLEMFNDNADDDGVEGESPGQVHRALLERGEQGSSRGDNLPCLLPHGDTHPHVLRQEVAEIIIVIIIISSPPANCS